MNYKTMSELITAAEKNESLMSTKLYWDERDRLLQKEIRDAEELDKIIKAVAEEQERQNYAEWTIEITKKRRAEWNEGIKQGKITGKNGKADYNRIKEMEKQLGWTLEQLKEAVKYHKL